MLVIDEVKNYLKVDTPDDDDFISQLIELSEIYIDSLVGTGYKSDNKAVKLANLLQLLIISHMYDSRTLTADECAMNKIAHSILDKLSNFTS